MGTLTLAEQNAEEIKKLRECLGRIVELLGKVDRRTDKFSKINELGKNVTKTIEEGFAELKKEVEKCYFEKQEIEEWMKSMEERLSKAEELLQPVE